MLLLIRHAKTIQDPAVPAERWALDPEGIDQTRALAGDRDWNRLRHWYSSSELKAVATARALTDNSIATDHGLVELRRGGWSEKYDDLVRRLFQERHTAPAPGWESANAALGRFDAALRAIAARHRGEDVVVVSHGLVISLWLAHLNSTGEVDYREWKSMPFPALFVISDETVSGWLRREAATA
ncbi:histidine phosphatase family protein [Micromonospora sp. LOL_021]|uniref:histidine phosphatase family protein n=1 Tax=Micromonospora sp. LOL_021 TaxID=3345417 RepID=UPI003A8771A0